MRIVLLLSILLAAISMTAQPVSIVVIDDDLQVRYDSKLHLRYLTVDEFKVLEWQPGYAYYQDGSSRSYEGIRFKLRENKAEINANKHILELLPGVVTGFSMVKDSSVSHIFINVPLQEPLFMELLAPGKADLLVLRIEDIKNDEPEKGIVTTIRFDKKEEIINYNEFFYVWYNGMIKKYKSSKKFTLGVMSDHSDEIEKYFKENKSNLKDPLQLIALFEYYNLL